MTREEASELKPGEVVHVQYLGYSVVASVVEVEPKGRYGPLLGWVMVEHISDTNYGDHYAGATYEAACEFITRPGDPPASMPFVNIFDR